MKRHSIFYRLAHLLVDYLEHQFYIAHVNDAPEWHTGKCWYTVHELAILFGCSESTARRVIYRAVDYGWGSWEFDEVNSRRKVFVMHLPSYADMRIDSALSSDMSELLQRRFDALAAHLIWLSDQEHVGTETTPDPYYVSLIRRIRALNEIARVYGLRHPQSSGVSLRLLLTHRDA